MAQSLPMTSSPPVKRFDWSNLGLRVASAVVIGPAALAAAWFGGWPYLVLIAIGVALLAIEWGGMSAPVSPTRVAAVVAAAVLIAVFVGYRGHFDWAWG
ncbi:MAG TPA: phosphatidate cytidylyltransferase, partial [Phenylobacterium sp.]